MRATVLRFGVVLSLMLALVGWAVSSPIGSSPDDDYHLTSIWCSEFSSLYPCTQVPGEDGGASFLVPSVLADSHVCFAFQPNQSAACVENVGDSLRLFDRMNQSQGLYPGGYYSFMSIFAGTDFVLSVSLMRITTALILCALLLLFLVIGSSIVQRSASLVIPVMFIPLALFLFASTNPSSWTVIGCTFFFLFLLNAFQDRLSRRSYVVSLILAAVSAALALFSRVDGSVFIAVIACALIALVGIAGLRRAVAATSVLILAGVAAVTSFVVQGLGPAGSATTIGESKYKGGLLVTNLLEVPGFIGGAVGGAPLGWGDTRMPGLVATFGLLALGGVATWGLTMMDRPKALASILLVAATLGVPVVLAQQQRIEVLDFIQARYLLPMVIVLVLTLALCVPSVRCRAFPRVPLYTLGFMMALSGATALWVNFHRYTYGADEPFLGRNLDSLWEGLWGPISGFFVVLGMVASAAFVVLYLMYYRMLTHGHEDREVESEAIVR